MARRGSPACLSVLGEEWRAGLIRHDRRRVWTGGGQVKHGEEMRDGMTLKQRVQQSERAPNFQPNRAANKRSYRRLVFTVVGNTRVPDWADQKAQHCLSYNVILCHEAPICHAVQPTLSSFTAVVSACHCAKAGSAALLSVPCETAQGEDIGFASV